MKKKDTTNLYNYERFQLTHYDFDRNAGPKEGEMAPDFIATTLAGKEVHLSNYLGKPIILESGSITCNVYVQKLPIMNALVDDFPECHYLVLYSREAHPGGRISKHKTFDEKMQRAHQLKNLEHEKRTILVDDLQGTAHQLYGSLPNFTYIIDANGKIVFKDKWGSPERTEKILSLLQQNKSDINTANIHVIDYNYKPSAQLSVSWRVFRRAGLISMWDFIKEITAAIFKHGLKHKPR